MFIGVWFSIVGGAKSYYGINTVQTTSRKHGSNYNSNRRQQFHRDVYCFPFFLVSLIPSLQLYFVAISIGYYYKINYERFILEEKACKFLLLSTSSLGTSY